VISVNPTTEKQIAEYPDHSGEQVEQFLDDGAAAKKEWRRSSFQKRASLMREVTNLLRQRQGELARLMTAEMGKPIVAGGGDRQVRGMLRVFFGACGEISGADSSAIGCVA